MNMLQSNIELLVTIPEQYQESINTYLLENYCMENPYKPLSQDEMMKILEKSRECYEKGAYKDFDSAIDDIKRKYGL